MTDSRALSPDRDRTGAARKRRGWCGLDFCGRGQESGYSSILSRQLHHSRLDSTGPQTVQNTFPNV